MTPLDTQFIFGDCSSGMITNVKAEMCPANSVELALNVDVDDIYGEARGRKGCTILGSQINGNNAVTGLYQFLNTAGTVSKLQAVVAGTIYHYTGGSWTSSGQADTSGLKTRFVTFLDTVARLNGTDAVVASTNGTSWGTNLALDTANFPRGKFGTVYKDQVIVAGVEGSPDTLYISSVPSSGVISWTSNNRTITINPEDGQNITALGEINGLVLVWKDRSMYTWNNRSTEADEIIRIGCTSQESVTTCGNVLSFFNQQGVWLTNGSYPVLISRPVQKWIDGMSASYYDDVSAFGDERYLYVSIGDCTVDGISYTNIVLKYSVNTKEWRVYSYADEVRIFASYLDTSYKIVVGTDASKVLQIESTSLTDNGTDIRFDLQSQDMFFGSRGTIKEISERVMAYGENIQGIVQIKIDGGDWKTLVDKIEKPVNNFGLKEPIKGNKLKFRIVGISKNRGRVQGIELPKISLIDYSE